MDFFDNINISGLTNGISISWKSGMRVANCLSSADNMAAGTTYSVSKLVDYCNEILKSNRLFSLRYNSSADNCSELHFRYDAGFRSIPGLRRLGYSRQLHLALLRDEADIYHIHGLWMLPNYYPAAVAKELGRPLVLSPHGMLATEALRFSWLKKQLALAVWQKRVLLQVDCFRATCEAEYQEIRSFGLKQPVAIIPNGIEVPNLPAMLGEPEVKKVLSLGRIHPKKGLDRLIRAWALVEADYPDWHLDIVGPDENRHTEDLVKLISELRLKHVRILGPVFGDEKVDLLARADLFVLPSMNENFGNTVAESLSCGTPVIATKGAPWAGLEAHRCGWWIEHGPEALSAALRGAMALPHFERRAMGGRGRVWMERDFGWHSIARQMTDVYAWLALKKHMPDCVRLG